MLHSKMARCCTPRDESDVEEHLLIQQSAQSRYSQSSDAVGESPREEDDTASGKDSKVWRQITGYAARVMTVLEFCAGLTFSQLLNRSIPHAELNGLRYSVQIIVAIVAVGISRKCDIRVKREQIGWLLLASVGIVATSYCSYGYSYYLPVGVAAGVARTWLVFFMYLSSCLVKRHIPWYYVLAGVICIIGIFLTAQPPRIFHSVHVGKTLIQTNQSYHSPCHPDPSTNLSAFANDSNRTEDTINHNSDNVFGYTLVFLDALSESMFVLIVNYKLSDMDTMVLMFWSSLFGVVTSFGIMGLLETPSLPHFHVCIWYLAGHMLFSGTHNFFFAYSCQVIPEKLTALIGTCDIPVLFLMQYTVLSGMYVGRANAVGILGAVLVFAGNTIVPTTEVVKYYRTKSAH